VQRLVMQMYLLFLTIRKKIKKRQHITEGEKSDFASILLMLGVWIDTMEEKGWNDDFLMQFKHLYLRLNWFMLKDPIFPLTPTLPEAEKQSLRDDRQNGEVCIPKWIPCLNKPLPFDHLPCNSHDSGCHYAKLLGCDLDDSFDLP